jgi:hypothetical protein
MKKIMLLVAMILLLTGCLKRYNFDWDLYQKANPEENYGWCQIGGSDTGGAAAEAGGANH